jgi:hypothetical protein
MLNRVRAELPADRVVHGLALMPVADQGAHLDQLVAAKAAIEFSEYRGGDAGFADAENGRKMVCAGPQCAALRGR